MTWLFGTTNCPDVHNHQKTYRVFHLTLTTLQNSKI